MSHKFLGRVVSRRHRHCPWNFDLWSFVPLIWWVSFPCRDEWWKSTPRTIVHYRTDSGFPRLPSSNLHEFSRTIFFRISRIFPGFRKHKFRFFKISPMTLQFQCSQILEKWHEIFKDLAMILTTVDYTSYHLPNNLICLNPFANVSDSSMGWTRW